MKTSDPFPPHIPDNTTDKQTANHLEEWKQARGVLQFFDDKLHDLRKYGFSFLTALLAAESILARPSSSLPDVIKLAVFCVTLLLIVALCLMDKNYRVFQEATATRAHVLEGKLNLELSDVIAYRYGIDRVATHVLIVYSCFICGVLILGWCTLYGSYWLITCLLTLGSLLSLVCLIIMQRTLRMRFRCGYEDWTVSRLECTVTDPTIRITLNNLTKETQNVDGLDSGDCVRGKPPVYKVTKPIVFTANHIIWRIRSENAAAGDVVARRADTDLKVYDSYTWFVTLPSKAGVYYMHPRDWPGPLFTIIMSA